MNQNPPALSRATFYLTAGAAVSILFSIAVSQTLMALAFICLLLSRDEIRFPPFKLPLALFFLGTLVSLALSADPRAGTPQIRKFYVYLIALLVYSSIRSLARVRAIVLLWSGVASLSALRSFAQFIHKYQQSEAQHTGFYQYYVGERITGFMSHWMTFGGEEMIVVLMLAAFLFFAPHNRWKLPGWAAAAVLLVSMTLGLTRSIWIGTVVAGLYLIWFWKRWLVVAVPALLALAMLAAPVRERAISVFEPHGDTDSNQFRVVVWRTGLRMIRAHPWFGLGPEEVKAQLESYIPADIPRPLPSGWYGHLHNIYLHYAAERGIPTMLTLMWMLGKILYDLIRALRRGVDPDRRWIVHGAVAVTLAILVVGFFELNLGDSEVLTMFLASSSLGYVAAES